MAKITRREALKAVSLGTSIGLGVAAGVKPPAASTCDALKAFIEAAHPGVIASASMIGMSVPTLVECALERGYPHPPAGKHYGGLLYLDAGPEGFELVPSEGLAFNEFRWLWAPCVNHPEEGWLLCSRCVKDIGRPYPTLKDCHARGAGMPTLVEQVEELQATLDARIPIQKPEIQGFIWGD